MAQAGRSGAEAALTDRLAALSDPLRLRLARLLQLQELGVGEIAQVLQLPQSTVSRHLKVLSSTGWVLRRNEGPASFYRLSVDDLPAEAAALWTVLRGQIDRAFPLDEERRRLEAVMAERRTDSMAFFNRVAGDWDEIRAMLFGRDISWRALLGLLPADWVVADLGCGTGFVAEQLAPFVTRVIAIDQSPQMLEAARLRLGDRANVACLEAPLETLPLPDAATDAATCMLVLHHVAAPDRVLAEMRRILKPGGMAVVVDMVEHERPEYRQMMGHRHLGFAPNQVVAWMQAAGLTQCQTISLPPDPLAKGPGLFLARAIVPS